MSITEFTVHNVLRTYSRQDRLGRVQKQTRGSTVDTPTDQVTLSSKGQKLQGIQQLASEVVGRNHPDLEGRDREEAVRRQTDTLLTNHQKEVEDERITPEALTQTLRGRYLG
jgi:hypothetical protein